MPETTLQLRVGVTRDRGFEYRTCLRPPISATVGRDPAALLPIDDPVAPALHTLFSVGHRACLLDFRPEWNLRVFRDDAAVSGDALIAEGTAFRRGRRILLQMAPGTRGSLRMGGLRLLFKWEEVPATDTGEVPLRDIGDVARCHACGLALRDALVREGLFARCDACRAINRFVDPEAPYRRAEPPRPLPEAARHTRNPMPSEATGSQRMAMLGEEADTMLGVPIFAPMTSARMDPLPEHLRPAGVRGRDHTPPDIRAARAPMKALEGLKTVFDNSPFLGPRPAQKVSVPAGLEPDLSGPVPAPPTPEALPSDGPPQAPPAWEHPRIHLTDEADTRPFPAVPTDLGLDVESVPELAPLSALDVAEPDPLQPLQRLPDGGEPSVAGLLDDAFYSAEPEAMPGAVGEAGVPWSTFSVLSANAMFEEGSGRIPKSQVRWSVAEAEDVGLGTGVKTGLALLVAVMGVVLLGVGIWLLPVGADEEIMGGEVEPPVRPEVSLLTNPENPPVVSEPITHARKAVAGGSFQYVGPDGLARGPIEVGGFAVDLREVSTGQYEQFLAATARDEPSAWSLQRPPTGAGAVTGVSVVDAAAFCAWADGRLPTEAEWQRAAFDSKPGAPSLEGLEGLLDGPPEWALLDGGDAVLKGGGDAPWDSPEYRTVHARIPPGAERWAPGPGFRCVEDGG